MPVGSTSSTWAPPAERGAVRDVGRDDEGVTAPEVDGALWLVSTLDTQVDVEGALHDEEQLVHSDVPVPDELALHLDDPHVVVVDLGQDPRAPQLVEAAER